MADATTTTEVDEAAQPDDEQAVPRFHLDWQYAAGIGIVLGGVLIWAGWQRQKAQRYAEVVQLPCRECAQRKAAQAMRPVYPQPAQPEPVTLADPLHTPNGHGGHHPENIGAPAAVGEAAAALRADDEQQV